MSAEVAVVIVTGGFRHDLIAGVGEVAGYSAPGLGSGRVLIFYAYDDPAHKGQVLEFLRANGPARMELLPRLSVRNSCSAPPGLGPSR